MSLLVETSNYTRLCGLLVSTGHRVLTDLLENRLTTMYNYCQHHKLGTCGPLCTNFKLPIPEECEHYSFVDVLDRVKSDLLSQNVLSKKQRQLLFPKTKPDEQIEVDDLDIALVCVLLRTICGFAPFKSKVWTTISTGTSPEECIARLYQKRDILLGRVFRPTVTDKMFDELWSSITLDLMRLSKIYTQEFYDNLEDSPINPLRHETYPEKLCQWHDPHFHLPRFALNWNKFAPIILFLISLVVALATYRSKHIKSIFVLENHSLRLQAFELNEISIFFNIIVFVFGSITIPFYTRVRNTTFILLSVVICFMFFRIVCVMSVIIIINYVKSLKRAHQIVLFTIVSAIVIAFVCDHYGIVDLDFV